VGCEIGPVEHKAFYVPLSYSTTKANRATIFAVLHLDGVLCGGTSTNNI
jgi:hypothetical protein